MSRTEITQLVLRRLAEAAQSVRSQWESPAGTCTRHFVVDNFLGDTLAASAYEAFPKDGTGFHSRESFREKKRTSAQLHEYAPLLADITYALQDPEVVQFVGSLTGLQALEPDPDLSRGGLSMMFRGDYLNPHLDNSHDAQRGRYRRLNLLYYVSPDWSSVNGGNFELWDNTRDTAKEFVALRDRLVVMETTKDSWHSVNEVKIDRPRCCISNYYYSLQSPDGSDYYHVTSFDGRPEEHLKKGLSAVDNALRGAISKITGKSRG